MTMQIQFPFEIGMDGRIAEATQDDHITQMIEQVLFTAPGERVNRPDFGCALQALLFEQETNERVIATQALVQSSLQRWLGDLIQVELVRVTVMGSVFQVLVQYVTLQPQQRRAVRFEYNG